MCVRVCLRVCPQLRCFVVKHAWLVLLVFFSVTRFWELDVLDMQLVCAYANHLTQSDAFDGPVFLPVQSPDMPHRFVRLRLLKDVYVVALCGQEPALSTIVNQVVSSSSLKQPRLYVHVHLNNNSCSSNTSHSQSTPFCLLISFVCLLALLFAGFSCKVPSTWKASISLLRETGRVSWLCGFACVCLVCVCVFFCECVWLFHTLAS